MERKKGNMRYLNVKQCGHGPFALVCMVTHFLMPFFFTSLFTALPHLHHYIHHHYYISTHLNMSTPPLHHHHCTHQLPPRHVHPLQRHHHNKSIHHSTPASHKHRNAHEKSPNNSKVLFGLLVFLFLFFFS